MAFTDIGGRRENAGDSAVTGDAKRAGSMMTEGIDTTKMDMLNNLAGEPPRGGSQELPLTLRSRIALKSSDA